ncbi:MAG: FAD:protein FMN transferase [Treponema sp.]|nr:FAD:protein FMN transferase [Treponema sp.]
MGIKRTLFDFIVLTLLLTACARPPAPAQMELALGTICVVNLYESGNSRLYSQIFARVREIHRTMTAFPGEFQDMLNSEAILESGSEAAAAIIAATEALSSGVVAINMRAGIEPVKVRADLLLVLEKALHFAELSDGAFDPTIGPLSNLWGIGTDTQRIPDNNEIAAALAMVNWRDLVIDKEAETAFLRREGMAIDLGGIAKGYAADEAVRIAREGGAKRGIIDFGGNIMTLGWRESTGSESLPWRIGIQDPLSERGDFIGVVSAHDTSVVTSGVYVRYLEHDGKRYHHILSTEDGYPVDNGLLAVTIVTENSMNADALSTIAFALGLEHGKSLIDSLPGVEAIFVMNDNTVTITGGLAGVFTLLSEEFTFR